MTFSCYTQMQGPTSSNEMQIATVKENSVRPDSSAAVIQVPRINGGYVDFHIHTMMKNYFRETTYPGDVKKISPGDTTNWKLYSPKNNDKTGFNNVRSHDQATYTLLSDGNASILCTSLYSLEKQSISNKTIPVTGVIKNARLRNIAKFSPLGILDKLISLRLINRLAVTGLSLKRQAATFQPFISNFQEFCAQLEFLDKQAIRYQNYKPVQLAKDRKDLDDKSKIWLVLSVEGAHNFYGKSLTRLEDIRGYKITIKQEEEIINNLRYIKDKYRLFFITPAHLFENKVAGGARGLDIDKSLYRSILARLMWDRQYSVVDNKAIEGINYIYQPHTARTKSKCICSINEKVKPVIVSIGWRFILEALMPNKNGKSTYIDMKHMDVKAREQIIDMTRKLNEFHFSDKKIPLLVSHAAVSGKKKKMADLLGLCPNYDDYREFTPDKMKEYYVSFANRCPSTLGMTASQVDNYLDHAGWYHPMSNNLYDEEIEEVCQNEGLIGITLEERALGKGAYNYSENPRTKNSLENYMNLNPPVATKGTDPLVLRTNLFIAEPFVRNLLYIVEHSGFVETDIANNTIHSWEHIGIGSDFDGIMNPIDLCPTAADIPIFYNFLCDYLSYYAGFLGKDKLLFNREPSELLDLVFYKNGEAFIKKYF